MIFDGTCINFTTYIGIEKKSSPPLGQMVLLDLLLPRVLSVTLHPPQWMI